MTLKESVKMYDVEVYSYLFGPEGLHNYKSLEDAWLEIKDWKYIQEE